MARILIIDDHPLVLDGMVNLIKQMEEPTEISTANGLQDAKKLLKEESSWDLLLLDLTLAGDTGFQLIDWMASEQIWLPTCILSASEQGGDIRRSMDAGAQGFISKSTAPDTIREAIRALLAGESWFPAEPDASQQQRDIHLKKKASELGITARQWQVLQLLGQGLANKVIAYQLHLSEATVKAHITALMRALSVRNRTEAVLEANKRGLI